MPIYDIFNVNKEKPPEGDLPEEKTRWFSAVASRFFLALLLVANVVWTAYVVLFLLLYLSLMALTFGQIAFFKTKSAKAFLGLKRSLVCALSLFVALFSPAFGIMVACTYFLMYDKAGIDEVVPSSLQEQFKEFFSPSSPE